MKNTRPPDAINILAHHRNFRLVKIAMADMAMDI
jgi:hypothetical protein